MKSVFLFSFFYIGFGGSLRRPPEASKDTLRVRTCGVAKTNSTMTYDGRVDISIYPWMGTFYYPIGKKKLTTAVVLVTRQIVLGAANEIDMLPKDDLRARSYVVLGRNCEQPGIKIRDYTFHPDFRRSTYSAIALIQLEVDLVLQGRRLKKIASDKNIYACSKELIPICGPPTYFMNPKIYAMTPSNTCKLGRIYIRTMKYVNKTLCRDFYRRTELDDVKFWPTHTTCARAVSGGKCIWRGGTALVTKQDGHWSLLGFGLSGPGCEAPARFLDYGMYQMWVRNSVARIGMPAITRMADNHIVMRRTLASLQRFGPCDLEETRYEMYTDKVRLTSNVVHSSGTYNLTLIHGVEYSCIILRGDPADHEDSSSEVAADCPENPKIKLRRWCAGPPEMCYGFQFVEIHFFLEFEFYFGTVFTLAAYGKQAKILSPMKAMKYANSVIIPPPVLHLEEVRSMLYQERSSRIYLMWFYKKYTNEVKKECRVEWEFVHYYNKKYGKKLHYRGG